MNFLQLSKSEKYRIASRRVAWSLMNPECAPNDGQVKYIIAGFRDNSPPREFSPDLQ